MPTSAVTGTKQVQTAGAKDDQKDEAPAEPKPSPAQDKTPAPLADHSPGGVVTAFTADGRHVNVDTGSKGWEDKLRKLQPKHDSLPKD